MTAKEARRAPRKGSVEATGVAIDHFVAELIRWGTRADVARSMGAADVDLTSTERWLLRRLYATGPVPVSELARFQGVDRSTMTVQVRRLEDRALVTRENDPRDRRVFLVGLTEQGRALHEAGMARAREVLGGLVSDWSSADRADLARLLDRLTDALVEQSG